MQIHPQIENTAFARALTNLRPSYDLSHITRSDGDDVVYMNPRRVSDLIQKGYDEILEKRRAPANVALAPAVNARVSALSALSYSAYLPQEEATVLAVTAMQRGDGEKGEKTVLGVIRNGLGLIQMGATNDIAMKTAALLFCVQDERDLLETFGTFDREAIIRRVYAEVCCDMIPSKIATIEIPHNVQARFTRDPGEHYGAVFISNDGIYSGDYSGFQPMVIGVLNYIGGGPRVFVEPSAPTATGRLAHRLSTTMVSARDAKLDFLFAKWAMQTLVSAIVASETRNAGLNELARRLSEVL